MAASNNHRLTVTVKPNSGHTLFRYTAKDIDGKVVRGAMEAADYDMLYTQLLAQGLYLQSATRRGAGRKPRTLRPQELSDLCRQLSTLLASGVSLVRALTIISQDEGISAGLRRIYESVLGEVRKGSSLSPPHSRRSQVFPTLMLGMIRARRGQRQAGSGRGAARHPLREGAPDEPAGQVGAHVPDDSCDSGGRGRYRYRNLRAAAVQRSVLHNGFAAGRYAGADGVFQFYGYQMVSDDTGCRGSGHGYPHAAAHSGRPAGNGPTQAQNAGFRSAQSGYLHGAVRANHQQPVLERSADRHCAADRP